MKTDTFIHSIPIILITDSSVNWSRPHQSRSDTLSSKPTRWYCWEVVRFRVGIECVRRSKISIKYNISADQEQLIKFIFYQYIHLSLDIDILWTTFKCVNCLCVYCVCFRMMRTAYGHDKPEIGHALKGKQCRFLCCFSSNRFKYLRSP